MMNATASAPRPRGATRSQRERVIQTLWFEALGWVIVSPLFAHFGGASIGASLIVLSVLSVVVMGWSARGSGRCDRRSMNGGQVMKPNEWDVESIRGHFVFPRTGRIVSNNAASTQPPRELLELHHALAPQYENVHRGQSSASQHTTRLFEAAYDDIARFVGAPSRNNIVVVRNTTEAHNAVMYSLMTQFRDGDNVVTTTMEHNSNFVPWYAMCHDILPKFGRRVALRLARFDPLSGELDLKHLASLIDARTKLVCCTGASNFLDFQFQACR